MFTSLIQVCLVFFSFPPFLSFFIRPSGAGGNFYFNVATQTGRPLVLSVPTSVCFSLLATEFLREEVVVLLTAQFITLFNQTALEVRAAAVQTRQRRILHTASRHLSVTAALPGKRRKIIKRWLMLASKSAADVTGARNHFQRGKRGGPLSSH